ncbi:Choline-sulfatase [Pontiella desulfatans]|uniref:Choline-sulfatase n=2 Tax=Pontiella desulfatans TaxID=2750659 RepID=A0A6C2U6W5_PONDE|nr:sulfatase S1_8 [Kiritimatiellales bacterium]VGO15126.1 Choline-sulfatase [Pontiella desulfatans]
MNRTVVKLFFLIGILSGTALAEWAAEKPNFVFFLGDDQLIYDYGCYGLPLDLTPVTDALAKEGMVFDQMFTAQAICAPSRSVLFTGQYPIRNGCFMNHTAVRDETKTVYDALKPLGYSVALAGKVHVKPSSVFRWDTYIGSNRHEPLALDKIDDYLSTVKGQPFCLFITSSFPHGPYPKNPKFPGEKTVAHPYMNSSQTKQLPGYYDNIEIKENELARVLEMLEKHGLEKDTVFVYSSDHGNGSDAKFTVYDRGLNVPFIVRWPGKVKPGRTDALTSYVDILPTFVELAGGQPPEDADGKSFCSVLMGDASEHHETVFGLMTQQGVWDAHIFPRRSARGKRYHYIHNFNALERIRLDEQAGLTIDPFRLLGAQKHPATPEEELYDTQADPFELVNLADEPGFKQVKAELKKELFAWMKEQNDFLTEGGSIPYLKSSHPLDQDSGDIKSSMAHIYDCPEELEGAIAEYQDPHVLTAPEKLKQIY